MIRRIDIRREGRGVRLATRFVAAGAGLAATLGGAPAGADGNREEWFGSPVSGATYHVERDAGTQTKSLVAPDGRRFPSTAAIVEAETKALTPLQRLLPPDLLALASDPARGEELVDVTFLLRRQPAHEAGVAARARANPALQAEFAREHRILDRIAPLRTLPGGRAPDVGTAMRDEARLLTDDEKATLREARDNVRALLAKLRREVMEEATAAVRDDQAALLAYVRGLPQAIDFGGSVTLNARSARVPARALLEIAERFPEVLRIEPLSGGVGALDIAVQTVNAGSWWTAGYNGSSATKIAIVDTGVDSGHPAFSGGVVTAANVFHSTASTNTSYADSSTSTDDFQGHGTRVAGIACSNDTTYTGIAYGGLIVNAKAGFVTTTGGASMYWADGRSAADWAFNNGATALSLSFYGVSGSTLNGTNEMSLFLDAAAFSLGVPVAVSLGNSGPNGSTLGYPGDAFNILACGSINDNGTASMGDDSINSSSSRGPTADGRQKPDLVGPGVNITSTAFDWETNADFGSLSGTSNVPPLVAGAVGLLQDYGAAAYPEGLNALLLTTANHQSPYGTSPDNTWGYGVLDCGGAYTYRNSVYEGQLTSTGPRFVLLRGGSLAAGGRATLVWNRQVSSAGSSIPTTYYGIQDLDLYVYDESSGTQAGSSTSTVNPNEQVAVTSAITSPVYKVYRSAASFTTSYSTEPFAVAAEATTSTTFVNPPALACTFTQLESVVAGSANTTVTVQVANTGDVAAIAPSVTLSLPTGYSIVSGANPQTLSNIAGQSTGTATWTIHSSSGPSGTGTISVDATTTAFGETFNATTLTGSQTVDVDAPTATVAISSGDAYTSTRSVTVTLSASDTYSGIAQMRVRNAGASWGAWTAYATSVNTTLSAGEGTKTFEAEFADGAGNVAAVSDSIVLDTVVPTGSVLIEGGAPYASASQVTLTTSASDATSGVVESRFSYDGVTWGSWFPWTATTSWTLASGEGSRVVYVQYRDAAGLVSATASDSIVIDYGPPSGTISIAGGATWTTSRTVALTLTGSDAYSGVADMRFSDPGSPWSAWQSFATTANWTLPAGDGQKTVYVQFRDQAGNVSDPASDTIGLDANGPTGTVSIAADAPYATSASVTLTLYATDSQNGVAQMRLSNDDTNWSAWTTYATSSNWTLSPGDGVKTVYAQFKDGLGNVAPSVNDTITVDTIAPTGTVAILGGAAAVNTPAVTLDLSWTDGGSGVSQVRLSNDGTSWSAWTAAKASLPWTMETGDGTHTVYAQFRDRAGNESSSASDAILVDTTPPTGTFVLVRDAAYVMPWETLTADTTASDGANGSGVAEFRSSDDGGATWTDWAPIPQDGHAIVPRPASGRDKPVTIQGEFRDVAGNVSAAATDATYLVDAQAPSMALMASFTGTVGLSGDRDAVHLGLVAGDKLSLSLKTKTLVKKADAHVDIDIYGPDHTLLVTGRYPATSKKPGVAKFAAPATGEYWVVMRAAGTAADTGVVYTMTVGNSVAKGSRAKKGAAPFDDKAQTPAASVSFDATAGLTLGGTLSGPLTLPAAVTLTTPDGTIVPVTLAPGPKGSQKLVAQQLTGGTGTYKLTIPATGAVTYSIALTSGKPGKLDEATLPTN